jgi:hypothetical protein
LYGEWGAARVEDADRTARIIKSTKPAEDRIMVESCIKGV